MYNHIPISIYIFVGACIYTCICFSCIKQKTDFTFMTRIRAYICTCRHAVSRLVGANFILSNIHGDRHTHIHANRQRLWRLAPITCFLLPLLVSCTHGAGTHLGSWVHACMCVCVYVCMCVCVYVCMCVYMYVCLCECVYVCMCVCMDLFVCLCVCTHVVVFSCGIHCDTP